MVTPCFSAKGRSVSAASSAARDRSTSSAVKEPRSARLSRSSASVRSIALVLTTCRRSISSSVSRSGSLRATSRSVWLIASGVRSSCEAFAAKRCCSATCASSRASMPSNASASSRNSSRRPSSSIRWESEPDVASRVASVMRFSGASMRPASSQPTASPKTRRKASTSIAAGHEDACPEVRGIQRTPEVGRGGDEEDVAPSRRRKTQTAASSRAPASIRKPA